MRLLLLTPLLLTACAQVDAVNPLADPRARGPFIARSDFPNPPNVGRAASGEGCSGEPLRAVAAPMPDYPARGWRRGLQGWSIVEFDVDESGEVENVRVARGVPGGSFDHEAGQAVEDWQFRPLSEGAHLTGCVVLFEFRMGEVSVR